MAKLLIPHLLFILLCFFGCLYHLFEVTRMFLAFKVKTEVILDSTSDIVPPIISFCMETTSLFRNKTTIFKRVTPSEIDNKTYDMFEIFSGWSTEKNFQQFDDLLQTEKIINFNHICYTFNYRKTNNSLSRDELKARNGQIYLFWMYNFPNNLIGFQLYLSSEYNVPNGVGLNMHPIKGKIYII